MTARVQMAKNTAIRVLLLHGLDEASVGAGLVGEDMMLIEEHAESPDAFAAALLRLEPNVIIAPASDKADAIQTVRIAQELCPAAAVILVVDSIDETAAVAALRAGAETLILRRNFSRLRTAIDAAVAVRKPLTLLSRRQMEVLRLVASGKTTRVIAETLGLSAKTIESHRTALMKRLGVHDVTALVRFAVRVGLAPVYEN